MAYDDERWKFGFGIASILAVRLFRSHISDYSSSNAFRPVQGISRHAILLSPPQQPDGVEVRG